MGELAVSFQREMNRESLAVYFKHLSDLTLYQVGLAVKRIIDSDERFPPVSRIKTLGKTFKKERPGPMQDVAQIEEVVLPNDLPRNKEDFFKAMGKLYNQVEVK